MLVKDADILKRLGIYGVKDVYAVYKKGKSFSKEDLEREASYISSFTDEDEEVIDNSNCDADFEKVSDGYKAVENYMYGDILVYRKHEDCDFPELLGIYDKTGLYKMQSARGTKAYLGHNGKSRCIAFPQCKIMNSTVFDNIAEHKVYNNKEDNYRVKNETFDFEVDRLYKNRNLKRDHIFTHISFDKWTVIGAIYGKALRVWRGVAKKNIKDMPLYMFVTYSEIYETIAVGCKWENLSNDSKYIWKKNLDEMFAELNTRIAYDLPNEDKTRTTYRGKLIDTTWVKRRAIGDDEEKRCMREWGDVYEPYAVKVRLKGNLLFDFVWRLHNNNPSLVQVRDYDYNLREMFKCRKSWNKSFAVIYAAWLIQYRNYWIKRKKAFRTCDPVWTRKEMKYAFNESIFDMDLLTTDEMKTVMSWYSVATVFNEKEKRPAHISDFSVNKRCEISWTLPVSLKEEDVILKNSNGNNISIEKSGIKYISDEVKLAASRMHGINDENGNHVVTVDGNKISTNEAVIYRVKYDMVNKTNYIEDGLNGRSYSLANGVQSLKREERKRLKIDGKNVKEVDYSSLHPHMLYALNGITFGKEDMYDVGRWYITYKLSKEEARKAVKMMLLRMINAKNTSNAIYSFRNAWNEEHGLDKKTRIKWLFHIFNAINYHHRNIAHEFCTGKGTYLMNLDGKLIREVCWKLTREKICALGIHDSVIVESKYADKAMKVMKEEYEKMFPGFTIKVDFK